MHERPLILVVDDEAHMLSFCQLELLHQGFDVEVVRDGQTALRLADMKKPAAVVLDVLMPGMDGYEVLDRLRRRSNVPVMMLTAKGTDHEKVQGLELGADDYMAKPFNPEELGARLRAMLRRQGPQGGGARSEAILRVRDVEIDFERRLVSKAGRTVHLTRHEWLALERLASRPGRVVFHEELLSSIWGHEHVSNVQLVRVCVLKLRAKLEDRRGSLIATVSSKGYVFAPDRQLIRRGKPQTVTRRMAANGVSG